MRKNRGVKFSKTPDFPGFSLRNAQVPQLHAHHCKTTAEAVKFLKIMYFIIQCYDAGGGLPAEKSACIHELLVWLCHAAHHGQPFEPRRETEETAKYMSPPLVQIIRYRRRSPYRPSLNCCQRFSASDATFCHSARSADHCSSALPAVVGKSARFSSGSKASSSVLAPE